MLFGTIKGMLSVQNVDKSFGGIRAVAGCSLKVDDGAIIGLIGPNGAGKTTLFKIISGFEKPDNGAIRFEGENVAATSSFELAKRGLIRTFQLSKALTKLTVEENMMLAPQFQHGERIWNIWLRAKEVKRQEEENRAKAISLLELFDLLPLKDEYAGALSGGQKKLLEMARAIMADPKMLLLDEPFSGVNPTLAKKLLGHIQDLRENKGMSFLIIEHDMPMIMQLCDYIYVLSKGKVIASGAPDEVRADERVLDAYLGGV
ncbi:branched-chain amino acid transport system ATP-binding protein [Methanophagales archaeon]|nr:branched-chain amino acid transport system ATP-binding protein [Methanophagales archaeon]